MRTLPLAELDDMLVWVGQAALTPSGCQTAKAKQQAAAQQRHAHEASACLLLMAQLLLLQLATPQLQPVALPGAAVVGFRSWPCI